MDLTRVTDRLDEELDTAAYAAVDASPNGLQVGPPEADVEHVAVAVDAARETVELAAEAGADLLVTHHGLFWGEVERLTGNTYRRVAPLVEADLPLYVSHLPLDGHPDLGNAAGVADLLALEDRSPFGRVGPETAGLAGTVPDPYTTEELRSVLAAALDTGGSGVDVLDFGPERVTDVAVVTGSGTDWIGEAASAGADALVTGEGKQQAYHEAKEHGITVVLAGHYATETFGVRSLASLLESWGLETTFLDRPTGL